MSQPVQIQAWTADKIFKILRAHRSELHALGVRKLGLFGSFKRGTATSESDLDFLVEFAEPTFDTYMDTKFLLEDLFNRKVDLVLETDIKPRLRSYILTEAEYVSGL
jgi:hypothetical protein